MVKYLNKEGLEKVFEIVKGNQDTLENDITQVLNGMSSTIDGKADSSDVYSKSEIDDLIGNINANGGDAIPRYVYFKADTEGEENTPTTQMSRHIESTNIKDADGNLLSNITDVIGALDSGDVIIFEGNDYYGSSYSWVQTMIGDDATVSYAVLYHQGETVYVTDGNAIYRLVVSQPYLHTYHTYLTAVNYALTNDEKAKLTNLPSDVYSKTEVNDLIDGIDVSGGGNIVKLTQAEYDALEAKDENTIYIITDAPAVTVPDGSDVDLSDYYTKSEVDGLIDGVDVDLSDYYTKSETDTLVNENKGVQSVSVSDDEKYLFAATYNNAVTLNQTILRTENSNKNSFGFAQDVDYLNQSHIFQALSRFADVYNDSNYYSIKQTGTPMGDYISSRLYTIIINTSDGNITSGSQPKVLMTINSTVTLEFNSSQSSYAGTFVFKENGEVLDTWGSYFGYYGLGISSSGIDMQTTLNTNNYGKYSKFGLFINIPLDSTVVVNDTYKDMLKVIPPVSKNMESFWYTTSDNARCYILTDKNYSSAIKKASSSEDGLMSKESYSKLNSLPNDAYSKSEIDGLLDGIDTGGSDGISSIEPSTSDEMLYATVDEETKAATLGQNILKENNDKEHCFGYDDENITSDWLRKDLVFKTYGEVVNSPLADEGEEIELRKFSIDVAKTFEAVTTTNPTAFTSSFTVYGTSSNVYFEMCKSGDDLKIGIYTLKTGVYDGQVKNGVLTKNGVISDSNYVLLSADDEAEIYLPFDYSSSILSYPTLYVKKLPYIELTHYIKYQGDKKGYILTDRNCKDTVLDNLDIRTYGVGLQLNKYSDSRYISLEQNALSPSPMVNGIGYKDVSSLNLQTMSLDYHRTNYYTTITEYGRGNWDAYLIDPNYEWNNIDGDFVDTVFSNGYKLVMNISYNSSDNNGTIVTLKILDSSSNPLTWGEDVYFKTWDNSSPAYEVTFKTSDYDLEKVFTRWIKLYVASYITFEPVETYSSIHIKENMSSKPTHYLNLIDGTQANLLTANNFVEATTSLKLITYIKKSDYQSRYGDIVYAYGGSWDYGYITIPLLKSDNASSVSSGIISRDDWNKLHALPDEAYSKSEVDALIDGIDVSGGDVDLTGYATEEWVGDNYYNKTYVDGIVSNVGTQINSKLPIDSFNTWSEGVAMSANVYSKSEIDNKLGDINTILENILS